MRGDSGRRSVTTARQAPVHRSYMDTSQCYEQFLAVHCNTTMDFRPRETLFFYDTLLTLELIVSTFGMSRFSPIANFCQYGWLTKKKKK